MPSCGLRVVATCRRQAFAPQPHYTVHRNRLCISMSTPLGKRTEWLHPYGPPERDRDPQGDLFTKTVHWDGTRLVSTFVVVGRPDVVTTRWVEESGEATHLLQETAFEDVKFTRRFARIEEPGALELS